MANYATINNLPQEVLEHVFSFMPLHTRKIASRVCHYWNEVAFSPRLLRRVALSMFYWDIQKQRENAEVLRASSRRYKNIWAPVKLSDGQFELFLEMVEYFGEGLEGLLCTATTASELRQIVERTPRIAKLTVAFREEDRLDGEELKFPILRRLKECTIMQNFLSSYAIDIPRMMPNLSKLSLRLFDGPESERSLQVLQQLGANLKHLVMCSSDYNIDIGKLKFPQLETLELEGRVMKTNKTTKREFFRELPNLRKVVFKFNVEEHVVSIVTAECPRLHTLHLQMKELSARTFHYLNRLKNLKVLELSGTYDPSMLARCKPLNNVETFHIRTYDVEEDEIVVERLAKLLPKVTEMKIVYISDAYSVWMLMPALARFPSLQRFHLARSYDEAKLVTFVFRPVPKELGAGKALCTGDLREIRHFTQEEILNKQL